MPLYTDLIYEPKEGSFSMSDEKMMEAAVSAVMNYIKEEELEQQKNAEEKELWGWRVPDTDAYP